MLIGAIIGTAIGLAFTLGLFIGDRIGSRRADIAAEWERVAAAQPEPFMQFVHYPPPHKRFVN